MTLWNRPHKETKAGERKRHIIIFNPEQIDEVNLQAQFEMQGIKSLSKDFLTVQNQFKSVCEVDMKKSNIEISIKAKKNQVTFTRFTYKHDKKVSLGVDFLIAVVPLEPIDLEKFKSSYTVDPVKK